MSEKQNARTHTHAHTEELGGERERERAREETDHRCHRKEHGGAKQLFGTAKDLGPRPGNAERRHLDESVVDLRHDRVLGDVDRGQRNSLRRAVA